MSTGLAKERPDLKRPAHLPETPVPPIPKVDESKSDIASVQYSAYLTGLSNHRTGLSEHRTSLSEFRTDLSMFRTDLSTGRTEMSMRLLNRYRWGSWNLYDLIVLLPPTEVHVLMKEVACRSPRPEGR